jgi:hypothetical protein
MRIGVWLGCGVAALGVGCEPAADVRAPSSTALEPAAGEGAERAISGQYEVTGVTIDLSSGGQRPILGRMSLRVAGDRYTSHFELSTRYPGSEAVPAEVVGTGEGTIEGDWMRGRADTTLVAASVPGVDVGFAFVPRDVSTRIVSTSEAQLFEDGTVRIEIENEPAAGADYSPTRTILVGYRVGDLEEG